MVSSVVNVPEIFTYLATTGEPEVEIIRPVAPEALPVIISPTVSVPVLFDSVNVGVTASVVSLADSYTACNL